MYVNLITCCILTVSQILPAFYELEAYIMFVTVIVLLTLNRQRGMFQNDARCKSDGVSTLSHTSCQTA